MNNIVKVTVVMPTFNRSELIESSVKSVLAQTYKNIELIIIDDNFPGSDARDKTKNIISNINDKRIIYVENDINCGPSLSRNKGISLATGDYLTFLDDDDEYVNTKIEKQVNYMIDNNLDLCFCDGAIYNTNNVLLKEKKRGNLLGLNKNELLRIHLTEHLTGTNTMMFKTNFLRKIGGFDNVKAAEEYYLTTKTIEANGKIGNVELPLTKTYLHTGKHITTSNTKIITENDLFVHKQSYFNVLSKKDIKQIKCRHYATLGYAYFKCRKLFKCFNACVHGFLISPKIFLKITKENIKKI